MGQESEIAECKECGKAVSPSYINRREHVVGKHMEGGELQGGSVLEQQDTLRMAMLQCFPGATVTNDLTVSACYH